MGRFRALKDLQAPSLGLVRPGQEFEWAGNIIGWTVEPLDDEARRMVEERAEALKSRGVSEVKEDKPQPTQPFPKNVMKASAGMTAPQIVGGTLGIDRTPAPDASAPQMSAPPRRRKAS
jgi:hypothetical protein